MTGTYDFLLVVALVLFTVAAVIRGAARDFGGAAVAAGLGFTALFFLLT